MSYFDIAIICIIAAFGLFGLWFGLVHTIGSLIGTLLGLFLASRYYAHLADWLINITGWSTNFSKVLMFIVSFIIIARLVGLIFWIIERALGIITKLPFIRGLNHLLGALFGVIEGTIVIGVSIYFISRFPLSFGFMESLANSSMAPLVVQPVKLLLPLIPTAIKFLQSTIISIF
ncbi:MAG: CvpA family protein [bacterium]